VASQLVLEQFSAPDEVSIGIISGEPELDLLDMPELFQQEKTMVLKGKTGNSNSADERSILSVDSAQGEIRFASGERIGIVSADFLNALCDAVHEKVGDEVSDFLYLTGKEWGRREFQKFKADVEKEKKIAYHLRNMGLAEFKIKFGELLSRYGWGQFNIEQKWDLVFVNLGNSAYAEMVSMHNRTYNDLFAGFFAGFFSMLIGVDFDAVEVYLKEDDLTATYLLADESVTLTVRQWLAAGKSYKDVLRMLEKQEHKRKKKRSPDVKEIYGAGREDEIE
jgi:predicted hydrocarbon binding protein